MRYILSLILSVSAFIAHAQQVNPVTDYTFANRMSAGRSTVTDTAAYFSVGPRFNAIRGLMPPMVTDTNSVSGSKRNGLLIFSIQKNRYVYWDSIGLKWSDIAGRNGTAITTGDTAVMLAPYLRGSGTANYLPKFNATRSLTNSKLFETQNSLMLNSATSSLAGSGVSSIEINATGTNYLAFKIGDVTSAVITNNNLGNMSINNYQDGNLDFLTSATVRGTFTADGNFVVNNLAGTGTRLVTASSLGALSTTSSVTSFIDTGVISTRAWRQKGVDSVNGNVTLKVNISDTSTMLSPYLRKVDTTSMLSAYLRKADTTAMLSPYLKESDTAYLSNRINLKVNISDTATMLSPYVRGSGTANYLPKFNASRSIVDSKVYETGTNLLFNTITPSVTASGYGTIDINGSTASLLAFKKGDTARGYIGHNGATMDINNTQAGDIRFYTSSTLRGRFQTDGTFRLNSLTGTGDRIVTADANGVLSATSSATGLVDTLVLSTRAWRQKGDDSLGAIIATKGSGTVTSITAGTGLSGGTITTSGTISADTAILATRLRVGKVVDSLALVKQNVLTNPVTGTGTGNFVPKFTGTSTIGNSVIYDNAGEILLGTLGDAGNYRLQVSGNSYLSSTTILAALSGSVGIATENPQARLVVSNAGANGYEFDPINSFISSYNRSTNAWTAVTFRAGSYIFNINNSNNALSLTSSGELLIATTTDAGDYKLQVAGNAYVTGTTVLAATSGNVGIGTASPTGFQSRILNIFGSTGAELHITTNGTGTANSDGAIFELRDSDGQLNIVHRENSAISFGTNDITRGFISSSGEYILNSSLTDAGDYKLQVSGNAYVTGTTVLAATGGRVGVATTSPGANSVLDVNGNLFIKDTSRINFRNSQTNLGSYTIGYSATSPRFPIRLVLSEDPTNQRYFEVGHYTGDNIANTWNPQILMNAYSGAMSLGSAAAPVASAQLEVTSTTKGFLPPRMTTTQRDAISSPAAGLVIYNTTTSKLQVYTTSWTDLH